MKIKRIVKQVSEASDDVSNETVTLSDVVVKALYGGAVAYATPDALGTLATVNQCIVRRNELLHPGDVWVARPGMAATVDIVKIHVVTRRTGTWVATVNGGVPTVMPYGAIRKLILSTNGDKKADHELTRDDFVMMVDASQTI